MRNWGRKGKKKTFLYWFVDGGKLQVQIIHCRADKLENICVEQRLLISFIHFRRLLIFGSMGNERMYCQPTSQLFLLKSVLSHKFISWEKCEEADLNSFLLFALESYEFCSRFMLFVMNFASTPRDFKPRSSRKVWQLNV